LWYKDVQTTGKTSRPRRLLPDEYRKTFANKQIVCVEYQDITDADEREIFQVCVGAFLIYAFFSHLDAFYREFN
jgi:predicted phage tail protein